MTLLERIREMGARPPLPPREDPWEWSDWARALDSDEEENDEEVNEEEDTDDEE